MSRAARNEAQGIRNRAPGPPKWAPGPLKWHQVGLKSIMNEAWRLLSAPREPSRPLGSSLGGLRAVKKGAKGPRAPQKLPELCQNGVKMGSKTGPKWDQIRSAQKCRFLIDFLMNFLLKKHV